MLAIIDEFGGARPGKSGTEWFGFSAVMISDEYIPVLRRWFNQDILPKFNRPPDSPLLMDRKKSPSNKYNLIKQLSIQQIQIVIAIIRTEGVQSKYLQQPGWCHKHYGKEVISSATQYAKELGEQATIIIHKHWYWSGLQPYFNILKCNSWYLRRERCLRIDFDRIVSCEQFSENEDPLISLADWVANASYNALIPDRTWGNTCPIYLNMLMDKIWRGPQERPIVADFGFMLFPFPVRGALRLMLPSDINIEW